MACSCWRALKGLCTRLIDTDRREKRPSRAAVVTRRRRGNPKRRQGRRIDPVLRWCASSRTARGVFSRRECEPANIWRACHAHANAVTDVGRVATSCLSGRLREHPLVSLWPFQLRLRISGVLLALPPVKATCFQRSASHCRYAQASL